MLALTAPPALALEPLAQCQVEGADGTLVLDVFDLNHGMTSHLENQKDRGTHLVVTSCHTGKFLRATVLKGPEGRQQEFPKALTTFEALTGKENVVTIGQLAEALEGAGVPTRYGVNRRETCACAASYPGLRGTKEAYGQQ
jgi:hypothetical protein